MFDNTFSRRGGNIMHTDQMMPKPMNKAQLEKVKKKIIQTYLFLISHTGYDPKVVELMKLSALADVQRRYEAGEPW
jgi:hypothetical protein